MQQQIEKFAKIFYSSYIAHYLSIDEDCDYMNNGLHLIINRSTDFSPIEKESIKVWSEMYLDYKIKELKVEENKIIFKFSVE